MGEGAEGSPTVSEIRGASRKGMQRHSWAWVPILEKDPGFGQKPALQGQWELRREQRESRLALELET